MDKVIKHTAEVARRQALALEIRERAEERERQALERDKELRERAEKIAADAVKGVAEKDLELKARKIVVEGEAHPIGYCRKPLEGSPSPMCAISS